MHSETKELIIFPPTKAADRITKVYLEMMSHMEEVDSLVKLCPHMSSLKVDSIGDMSVDQFVRKILEKINRDSKYDYLRLLSFCTLATDDQLIQVLETMKNDAKLLVHYCDSTYW